MNSLLAKTLRAAYTVEYSIVYVSVLVASSPLLVGQELVVSLVTSQTVQQLKYSTILTSL